MLLLLLLLLLLSRFSRVRLCAIIELLIVAFTFNPHFYYWLLNAAQLLFSVNSSFLFFCYEEVKGLERMCSSRFIPLYTSPALITLAWKIPWTEEPGRLQSTESLRIGHNWVISLSLFTFMHWRRKWQPTPAFLPGKSRGQGSLVGCYLWGCTESDTTEATYQQQQWPSCFW